MTKSPAKPQPEDGEETGRPLFGWLERPGATFYVILSVAAIGVVCLFLDSYRARSGSGPDSLWGFFALTGALGLTLAVFAGKALRALLGRGADYYEADDDRP